MYNLCEHQFGH